MNNISKKGLGLFGPFYQVSDAIENPDAILVRSAQVDTDNFNACSILRVQTQTLLLNS